MHLFLLSVRANVSESMYGYGYSWASVDAVINTIGDISPWASLDADTQMTNQPITV